MSSTTSSITSTTAAAATATDTTVIAEPLQHTSICPAFVNPECPPNGMSPRTSQFVTNFPRGCVTPFVTLINCLAEDAIVSSNERSMLESSHFAPMPMCASMYALVIHRLLVRIASLVKSGKVPNISGFRSDGSECSPIADQLDYLITHYKARLPRVNDVDALLDGKLINADSNAPDAESLYVPSMRDIKRIAPNMATKDFTSDPDAYNVEVNVFYFVAAMVLGYEDDRESRESYRTVSFESISRSESAQFIGKIIYEGLRSCFNVMTRATKKREPTEWGRVKGSWSLNKFKALKDVTFNEAAVNGSFNAVWCHIDCFVNYDVNATAVYNALPFSLPQTGLGVAGDAIAAPSYAYPSRYIRAHIAASFVDAYGMPGNREDANRILAALIKCVTIAAPSGTATAAVAPVPAPTEVPTVAPAEAVAAPDAAGEKRKIDDVVGNAEEVVEPLQKVQCTGVDEEDVLATGIVSEPIQQQQEQCSVIAIAPNPPAPVSEPEPAAAAPITTAVITDGATLADAAAATLHTAVHSKQVDRAMLFCIIGQYYSTFAKGMLTDPSTSTIDVVMKSGEEDTPETMGSFSATEGIAADVLGDFLVFKLKLNRDAMQDMLDSDTPLSNIAREVLVRTLASSTPDATPVDEVDLEVVNHMNMTSTLYAGIANNPAAYGSKTILFSALNYHIKAVSEFVKITNALQAMPPGPRSIALARMSPAQRSMFIGNVDAEEVQPAPEIAPEPQQEMAPIVVQQQQQQQQPPSPLTSDSGFGSTCMQEQLFDGTFSGDPYTFWSGLSGDDIESEQFLFQHTR